MLEAFCRGCGQYMKELSDQLTALNKMKMMSDRLQNLGKKKTDELLQALSDPHFTQAMKNITSPLDPAVHLKELK
jgi:phosphatidylinositol-4,5-bisphosphate 3-kinase